MFNRTNPRKAKFGFKVLLSGSLENIVIAGEGIKFCLLHENIGRHWIETPNNMGKSSVLVYTDDEEFSNTFGVRFCGE